MKEYIEKYIDGECSEEELKKSILLLQGKFGEHEVNKVLKEHWEKTSAKYEGIDEKFENVLSRIHHQVNLNENKAPKLIKFYKKFAKVAAILLLPKLSG